MDILNYFQSSDLKNYSYFNFLSKYFEFNFYWYKWNFERSILNAKIFVFEIFQIEMNLVCFNRPYKLLPFNKTWHICIFSQIFFIDFFLQNEWNSHQTTADQKSKFWVSESGWNWSESRSLDSIKKISNSTRSDSKLDSLRGPVLSLV